MFFPIPDFKGFDFFPHNLRIPFMRYKGICLALSLAFMAGSLALYFTKGLNYGVDFVGGSLIEVQHKNGPADLAAMRDKLNALGIGSVQIQSFGTDTDVLIRVEQQKGGEGEQQVAMKKVVDALGPEYTQRRIEVVGPTVSSELRRTGIIAVFASLLAIIAYVWFRFEWQFAAGTIVALLHDVLVTVGLFSLLGMEFDLSIVAALLTILGYSVNDSVVVSDRIRENLRKYKRMELTELLNVSINETFSRTILTGVTAIAGILALLIFGGEVIRNFSFAMLFGILIGTYSSVFIAAPMLGYLGIKRETVGAAAASKETSPVIAPASTAGADRATKAASARPSASKKAAPSR
jgi:preprotein translocase SecF subunit